MTVIERGGGGGWCACGHVIGYTSRSVDNVDAGQTIGGTIERSGVLHRKPAGGIRCRSLYNHAGYTLRGLKVTDQWTTLHDSHGSVGSHGEGPVGPGRDMAIEITELAATVYDT